MAAAVPKSLLVQFVVDDVETWGYAQWRPCGSIATISKKKQEKFVEIWRALVSGSFRGGFGLCRERWWYGGNNEGPRAKWGDRTLAEVVRKGWEQAVGCAKAGVIVNKCFVGRFKMSAVVGFAFSSDSVHRILADKAELDVVPLSSHYSTSLVFRCLIGACWDEGSPIWKPFPFSLRGLAKPTPQLF